jgi:hypothetical protein
MPKKQTTSQSSVAGAAPARVAKPAAPRVTSSKHKKAAPSEPVAIKEEITVVATPVAVNAVAISGADPLEVISKLAYGFWEARGRQEGMALADWVRAEEEYRRLLALA